MESATDSRLAAATSKETSVLLEGIDLGLDFADKKSKAPIWDHFKSVPSTQTSSGSTSECAKCIHCNQTIKTSTGNTTGMRRHLENKHFSKFLKFKKVQDEFEAKKSEKRIKPIQPAPAKSETRQQKLTDLNKWDKNNPKAKALTVEIGKWMASSLHPYSLVEEQGLRNVFRLAQPLYNVPSSKTFSRKVIPQLYTDVRNVISNSLNKQKSVLSSCTITTDMWTSLSNSAYLAVTAHFMDEDYVIKNYCLGCYTFQGEHSGENIAHKINECLVEWGLNDLSVPLYAVTDNAKNIKLAMSLCRPMVKPLNCFAHTLQLALGDAKKATAGMVNLVSKAKKVVGHYKHSATATERLHGIQKEMGKDTLNLIQNVETRWNSEYLMLSRLLTNKDPLSRDLAASGTIDNLTVSEWRMVEAYVKILQPLYEATVEMCSSVSPTASLVIPIIYCVQEKLRIVIRDEQGVGKMFAQQLLQSFMSRFPNSLKVDPYINAMLVDPRFKDVALEPHERALWLNEVKSTIIATKGQQSQEMKKTEERDDFKHSSLWSVFKKAAAKKAEQPTSTPKLERDIDEELKVYFAEETIAPSEDPCAWWRKNSVRFPLMKCLVQKYLGIPATEVASERTFSSAGNVVTSLRERLTSDHVEELVFLHQNSKLM